MSRRGLVWYLLNLSKARASRGLDNKELFPKKDREDKDPDRVAKDVKDPRAEVRKINFWILSPGDVVLGLGGW